MPITESSDGTRENGLEKLCNLKQRILDAIHPFRQEFRSLLSSQHVEAQYFGNRNQDVVTEINNIVRLLGLQLRDPLQPSRIAYLRYQSTTGKIELRTKIDGKYVPRSERKSVPTLPLRVRPGFRRSPRARRTQRGS